MASCCRAHSFSMILYYRTATVTKEFLAWASWALESTISPSSSSILRRDSPRIRPSSSYRQMRTLSTQPMTLRQKCKPATAAWHASAYMRYGSAKYVPSSCRPSARSPSARVRQPPMQRPRTRTSRMATAPQCIRGTVRCRSAIVAASAVSRIRANTAYALEISNLVKRDWCKGEQKGNE